MDDIKIAQLGIYDADTVYRNIKVTPKRRVSIFEVDLPIEDGGLFHIDNKSYPIRSDTIICAKPGSMRNTTLPFKCHYLHLNIDGYAADCLSSVPDSFKLDDPERYRELFKTIILTSKSNEEYSRLLLQSKTLELLYLISKDGKKYSRNESGRVFCNPIITDALEYIDNNFCDKNTLDEISGKVNLSPIYFHKLFKTAVGETPYKYILKKRLKKSLLLIMTSGKSLTEIALECGFSSQSYFNYVFKKECGKTPGEYRTEMYHNYAESDKRH